MFDLSYTVSVAHVILYWLLHLVSAALDLLSQILFSFMLGFSFMISVAHGYFILVMLYWFIIIFIYWHLFDIYLHSCGLNSCTRVSP